MKTYTQDELHEILEKHKMWLNNEAGGKCANFREADLREANFQKANLWEADFQEADIDYSCWPLWCGSFDVKIDKRIAAQFACHFCRTICDDSEVIVAQTALLPLANQFHWINECGEIKPMKARNENV